ncbi:MAG: tRNA (adenosine(37)-N6)-threonylcarbamoyltransferase complex ATPase subunit type 1 TsaE [Elusimicrobiota bacterium]
MLTNNPEETIKVGEKISKYIKPGTMIILSGELGAGKTTLLKGLAGGLGIKKSQKRITSSSFVLVREFPEKNFYHIDLFRLSPKDFFGSGFDQYISGENIVAIEWGEMLKISKKWQIPAGLRLVKVEIKILGQNKRKISASLQK